MGNGSPAPLVAQKGPAGPNPKARVRWGLENVGDQVASTAGRLKGLVAQRASQPNSEFADAVVSVVSEEGALAEKVAKQLILLILCTLQEIHGAQSTPYVIFNHARH